MGLTLNSNSLTLQSAGGGGSGLTQAQVDARVEANTDYVHLGTLTADASSELVFTGFDSGYNHLKIIFDGLYLSSTLLIMSVYLDGANGSNETYLWSLNAGNGGSESTSGSTSDNAWRLTYVWNPNGEVTGQAVISNADANARTPVISSILGGRDGNTALRWYMGGQLNDSFTGEVTGIRIRPSSGTFVHGKVYLYGLNKND